MSQSQETPHVFGHHGWGATFASLRYASFRTLWITTVLSAGGNWIQQVTLSWLAWEVTESPIKVAVVLGLRTAALMASPIAGVIADRFDRRRVMMLDHLAMMVIALAFAIVILAGVLAEWHLYAFALLGGLGWALNNPVRQVLVGNSVPPHALMNAVALNSMGFNTMRMVGPALGGQLIWLFGPGINFLLQALLYVAVFIALIPYRPITQRDPTANPYDSTSHGLGEAFRYIWNHPVPRSIILLTFMPTFALMAFITTQIPFYADRVLGDETGRTIGWLFSAMGVGGLIGTLLLARFSSFSKKGWLAITGVVGSAITLIVLAQVEVLWLAMGLLGLNQVFFNTVMITNNTVLQTTVPNHVRGRVLGIYMLDVGLQPLGGIIAGFIVAASSVALAWTVGGVAGLIGVILVAAVSPALRNLRI